MANYHHYHHRQCRRAMIACLSWLSLSVIVNVCSATPLATKEAVLQNAMQNLLHINPAVSSSSHRIKSSSSADSITQPPPPPQPPAYMMQLYQQYLSSDAMKSRSNTIRSIVPIRGKWHDR